MSEQDEGFHHSLPPFLFEAVLGGRYKVVEKNEQDELLRVEFARTLHKALRQFEVEKCPEAFDMRVHIGQLIAKVKQHYEQKRLDRPEFNNALEADAHNWDARELDRPELREKIFRVLWYYVSNLFTTAMVEIATDQILALIPDIEELDNVRDEITRLNKKLDDREEDLIEAKKQERERIMRQIFPQDIYPTHLKTWAKTIEEKQGYQSTMTAFLDYLGTKWQALKEEK